jgi:hypothetical protein
VGRAASSSAPAARLEHRDRPHSHHSGNTTVFLDGLRYASEDTRGFAFRISGRGVDDICGLQASAYFTHGLQQGLPFDPACLRFHEVERTVLTASAAQVRQPIRSDTARAARYGTLLDPLRAMLAGAPAPR